MTRRPFGLSRTVWPLALLWLISLLTVIFWPVSATTTTPPPCNTLYFTLSPRPRQEPDLMYHLTLCDRDGSLVAVLPESPVLPRFMHLTREDEGAAVVMSDEAEPGDADARVVSFGRVASSVWIDDDRNALFVRLPA